MGACPERVGESDKEGATQFFELADLPVDDLRGDVQLFGQTIPATEGLAVPAQKAQGNGDLVGGKGCGAMLTGVHRDLPVFLSSIRKGWGKNKRLPGQLGGRMQFGTHLRIN